GERFWLLAGLADATAWAEVRGGDVTAVLDVLAARCGCVVAQVGSSVEDLGGLGGPDRYGMSRGALARADVVVGVAPATPTGLAPTRRATAMANAEPTGAPRALSATEQVVAMVRATMSTRRVSAGDRPAVAELVAEAVDSYRRQAAVGAAVPLVNPRDLTARVL